MLREGASPQAVREALASDGVSADDAAELVAALLVLKREAAGEASALAGGLVAISRDAEARALANSLMEKQYVDSSVRKALVEGGYDAALVDTIMRELEPAFAKRKRDQENAEKRRMVEQAEYARMHQMRVSGGNAQIVSGVLLLVGGIAALVCFLAMGLGGGLVYMITFVPTTGGAALIRKGYRAKHGL